MVATSSGKFYPGVVFWFFIEILVDYETTANRTTAA